MPKKRAKPRAQRPRPVKGARTPSDTDPLEDSWQAAWASFTGREQRYLEDMFEISRTGKTVLGYGQDDDVVLVAFRDWVEAIIGTEVVIKPAGRARVKRRDLDYAVEVQWIMGADGTPKPKSITVVGNPYLTDTDPIPHHEHLVALALHLDVGQPKKFRRMPSARPAPGEPIKITFYAGLVEAYDALLRDGHPAPAVEIAERLGEKHSTVKVWLHRGRKYLAQLEQKETR